MNVLKIIAKQFFFNKELNKAICTSTSQRLYCSPNQQAHATVFKRINKKLRRLQLSMVYEER